jgi:hypothetical protein
MPPRSSHSGAPQDDAPPKVIMSKAAKRKLKKAHSVVTSEMREQQREELRELRKHLRMVKSNGGRRKISKLMDKRARDDDVAMDLDEDARPRKKGRRLEKGEWIPPVQTLPNHMLPKTTTMAETAAAPQQSLPPLPARGPQVSLPNPIQLSTQSPASNEEDDSLAPVAQAARGPRPAAAKRGGSKRSLEDASRGGVW